LLYKTHPSRKIFHKVVYIGYKYQFPYIPYILRAKVTRAGSLPLPELPPYPLHIIVVVGGWWLVVVVVVVVGSCGSCSLWCVCGASAVHLQCVCVLWLLLRILLRMLLSAVRPRYPCCEIVVWLSATR